MLDLPATLLLLLLPTLYYNTECLLGGLNQAPRARVTQLLLLVLQLAPASAEPLQLARWAIPSPWVRADIGCDLLHTQEILQAPLAQLTAKATVLIATPWGLHISSTAGVHTSVVRHVQLCTCAMAG